jgi:hypothetical protein
MSNAFNDELAGAGHNSGIDPAEIIGDQIEAALLQFTDRAAALVKSAADRTIVDNDGVGRAADTQTLIRTLTDTVWARAKEIADPHNRSVAVVRTRTEKFIAALAQADETLNTKIREFRALQRKRAEDQRAEQQAREAALRGPEVVNPQVDSSPIALPKARGDYGSTVSDRAVVTYTYADPRKLPRAVLDQPGVEKAIQTALRAYMKIHPKTKGVTASTDMTTTHRRPI